MLRKIENIAGTTIDVTKKLTLTSIPATVGAISREGIQKCREVEPHAVKHQAKDYFAYDSSAVNLLAFLCALQSCLRELIGNGSWRELSNKQRLVLTCGFVLALGAVGYSLSRFGVEENVLAASLSMSAGVGILSGITFFMEKNRTYTQAIPTANNSHVQRAESATITDDALFDEERRPVLGSGVGP